MLGLCLAFSKYPYVIRDNNESELGLHQITSILIDLEYQTDLGMRGLRRLPQSRFIIDNERASGRPSTLRNDPLPEQSPMDFGRNWLGKGKTKE